MGALFVFVYYAHNMITVLCFRDVIVPIKRISLAKFSTHFRKLLMMILTNPNIKSGLTPHDFRRTTDQIGRDMSRRVIVEDRGK